MAVWDESKHFRGYHGRFSFGRDRSGDTPSARSLMTARQRKEGAAGRLRAADEALKRRERGLPLSDQQRRMVARDAPLGKGGFWARYRIGESGQHPKTRQEALREARGDVQPARSPRTGIKQTFSGKAKVERGNYRTYKVPDAQRPGWSDVHVERRVRRSFDWPKASRQPAATAKTPAAKSAPKPASPVHPTFTRTQLALKSDAWMREELARRNVEVPKRAGRNQLMKLLGAS